MVNGNSEGIYGNEIGIILGVNKNKSIKDLSLEKFENMCKNKEESYKEKEINYWSDTIKEIICKEFTIRSGKKVRKELKIATDEEYSFMHCKVDRRIVGENSILLCIIYSGNAPEDVIDDNVLLECQHNMRVTKTDKCYVACLINDKKFEFKEVLRDEKIIYKIIDEEKKFYCTSNR
ncbi:YqaJ viral recombinase family protein [Clostridium beijerinckii]|uniref:YqaJ viral recombinase family protein n=1 Tax=Clostridium beijerinckii TaxID=1520 RepID=UPI00156F76FE|nr:YqaJ viral recombinase family protein [Clostridium beijerinckii]NRT72144.1 putative phage-related endonuclease [Clostridium beijerinckii]